VGPPGRAREVREIMAKLRTPVVFRSNRLNLTVEVKGALSQTAHPNAALHPDVKSAAFRSGVYQTDDPEIADALDKRPDVWRMDDPAGDLKADLGVDGYEKLKQRMAEAAAAEAGNEEPSEDSEEN